MRRSITRAFQHSHVARQALQTTVPVAQRVLQVYDFGSEPVQYDRGLKLQESLAAQRLHADSHDTLLQLQHPPVYTYGKRGNDKDLVTSRQELERMGIAIHQTSRGGEVTYHGPGQLVVYPIVSLRELGIGARAYVEGLEDCLIQVADTFGLQARGRVNCRTGVWVGDRKLAAIGVRISQGITTHGIALNVGTDLEYFKHIVACGIPGADATSLERELQQSVSMAEVTHKFDAAFRTTFGYGNVQNFPGSRLAEVERTH